MSKEALLDRGENISLMEPMQLSQDSRHRSDLTDLAMELTARASAFGSSLPPGILSALSDLVRAMNCYYSNLIEGHDTHPVDIERALNNDYSKQPEQRNLQLEARAHITVQQWIDQGGLKNSATSQDGIREIHRRFEELLPEELLEINDPETDEPLHVTPGKLRDRDVKIGQLVAVSPATLPKFMQRFEEIYRSLGKSESLISCAAAHHRLLWIHPFLDGNGRVARLMSHAMLLDTLDTGGIWSIARGLARNEAAYKQHLIACDQPRRNDLDGRGHLSEEALAAFTRFFLQVCIDQVSFMQQLVQPAQLRNRIMLWAEELIRLREIPQQSSRILEAILYRGELPRGELPQLLDTGDRQARRVVSSLVEKGVITSTSSRAPLHVAFPARLAGRWMPGLFPDRR
jgi:Fic family protein